MAASLAACGGEPTDPPPDSSAGEKPAMLQIPESIAAEHRELHEALAGAAAAGGELAVAAGELERALAPHFEREEAIATPPLGLLPLLAKGDATAQMIRPAGDRSTRAGDAAHARRARCHPHRADPLPRGR
jgi:hypothetical protein